MWSKSVIFTFLLVILFENGLCDCTNREYQTLTTCYNTYFHMLGTSFAYYLDDVIDYYKNTNGIDTLCRYYNNLQDCLGDTVIDDCINHVEFRYLYGPEYSYEFSSNFFELEFTCGKGNKALKNELSCLQNLLPNCGKYIDTCSEAKDYINCYANAAKNSCGQDGYYYAYNDLSIAYCHSDLQCNTCTSGTASVKFSLIALLATVIVFFAFKY